MTVLLCVPIAVEIVNQRVVDESRDLTMAEKVCVLTTNEEDVKHMGAFATEKLQFLSERLLGTGCWGRDLECGGDTYRKC